MAEQPTGDATYAVGYTDEERQRLIEQARAFVDLTRQFFLDAGIGPGMRVLDVGCGVGDVSLLAAPLMGPGRAVVGVDTDARSLEVARDRAAALTLDHVAFRQSDLRELTFMDVLVCSPSNDRGCDVQEQLLRSILPLMERFGIATAAEVGVETIAQRLRHEAIANKVVATWPPVMRAWARKPPEAVPAS